MQEQKKQKQDHDREHQISSEFGGVRGKDMIEIPVAMAEPCIEEEKKENILLEPHK